MKNVLVIGCGDAGRRHADAWIKVGAKVSSFYDSNQDKSKLLSLAFDASSIESIKKDSIWKNIDIVSVCTPTNYHFHYSILALLKKKNVLCEKPICLSYNEAKNLENLSRESGLVFRLGFVRRYDPLFSMLENLIKNRGGKIFFQVNIEAGIRPKAHMHDANGSGGPIIDMCCHLFDMWGYMFNCRPEVISAEGSIMAKRINNLAKVDRLSIDTALFTIKYGEKAIGSIFISWGLPIITPSSENHTYYLDDCLVKVNWREGDIKAIIGEKKIELNRSKNNPWVCQASEFIEELEGTKKTKLAKASDGVSALITSLEVLQKIERKNYVQN